MNMKQAIRHSLRNGSDFFYPEVLTRKCFIVESELFDNKFFIGSSLNKNGKRYFNIYEYCEGSGRVFMLLDTERCTLNGAKIKMANVRWRGRLGRA